MEVDGETWENTGVLLEFGIRYEIHQATVHSAQIFFKHSVLKIKKII